ncbi:Fis family transcriptional regulator [Methylophilaceae bacterium]|jgi:Fis family transcriptional regulator|uniref:Putative Fis-like DNA-binding protein n=1 Tax=Methylophilales bacterium HTCC2181 TaxID=383631 RepID=A0P836_9PROT|nr:Transcriptional Regulator, Fis family protein [Methylophilales bacterium HTCC2181]MBT3512989.1 Fis family transcriptional regulator [Nitrosomonadales bacterium]MCH9781397.1 Fis family transcriptional regulator [Betaproteobacteria bacterium]MDA7751316.1 Fis family transcriptional regulator [Methylophilaceae bacterium]MBT6140989.1 Fis family transcriptional regulator [Nitrosomonadales bacterium]|tara:strand:- start:1725 stop:1961 length:237 start_codon:yes stop_codon:yes gene_type:complete
MNKVNLSDNIEMLLDQYFTDLAGESPGNLYNLVVSNVEKPLLLYVMNYAEGNQSKAAEILGLNRNTLRKKLKTHNIDI